MKGKRGKKVKIQKYGIFIGQVHPDVLWFFRDHDILKHKNFIFFTLPYVQDKLYHHKMHPIPPYRYVEPSMKIPSFDKQMTNIV